MKSNNQKLKQWIFYFSILSFEFFIPSLLLPVNAQVIIQTGTPTLEQLRGTEKQPSVLPNPQPLPENTLPPLEDLFPKTEPNPLIPQPSFDQIPGKITVIKFEVIGSTVFSPKELAKLLEPFTKRPISFAELQQVQETINQLYVQRGYITSGAYIPPQELQDGTVKIAVIEGEVESINISGLKRLQPGYVRSRLGLGTKTPLDQNRLLLALQMLQLDPLIAGLSAELAAGSRPGVSVLEIKVREKDAFSTQISIDNQRSPSVGTVRRQAQINHNNLLGFGDRFHVGYTNTDGSNSIDDLSYTVPINPQNGTIGLSYSRTNTNIIEEPFNVLDIQSASRNYQITYRQPLYQTPNQEFTLGITGSRQESETSLLNEPFSLSPGANDQGETRISAIRFFQEYTQRDNVQVFAVRSQFSFGIDAFNATNNDSAPDSQFVTWRGQTQYLRLLTPDTTLVLRSDIQLSDRPLVALEQFSAGGQQSVRGYRQDYLLADNGLFASAEVRTSILRIPKLETTLQVSPFFDVGTVWNHSSSDVDIKQQTLTSVGVGLRLLVGENFNAKIDWGIPLLNVEKSGNSLQENGLYFSVEYKPF
ncbi:ShlB/FhaC/HecB family hemolysin secretion/activation protein [Anabaena catenula]|uniref:ShlB/FhaC/HecB family hemolysin secretion/activation protein n=1 Tax=Anabaena catenula FACHB-362 TaxID=2692877 RepID=A0ABR8J5K2_9NOST|nr:ShlB/FhaC/HecB family hemolysin secretion/activation protein [Anabaena catenula]MBD2692306.1 ShlB/FhaC/HecB family hemolysin secretion/activation protein [Anabaena catenula FACHB-362]